MYTDPDKKNKKQHTKPSEGHRPPHTVLGIRHSALGTRHTTPIPAQQHGDNGKGKTQFVPQENKYPEAFASG